MQLPRTATDERTAFHTQSEEHSALEQLQYLCPRRYFRFYMLYEQNSCSSCWLPEGYDR